MNKFLIFIGVLVYTLVVAFTVFSISKYYMFTKITRDIESSFIDYDFNDFVENISSADTDIPKPQEYGVQEINGQTCFVMEDLPKDPELVMILMIPVFLKMDFIPIEHKKPRTISLYI